VVDGAAAATTLEELRRAVRRGDERAARDLGVDGAADQQLVGIVENAESLGLTDVTFRYVAEDGRVSDAGEWTATVETTWRFAGLDRSAARTEVRFSFADAGGSVAAIGGGRLTPLWLTGAVAARRADGTLVLGTAAPRLLRDGSQQAVEAMTVVARVLGDRADGFVVEIPDSTAALHAALGAAPGTYDQVAAVTTSADGTNVPGAPIHVFLNPAVYGALGGVAAQVVMSHEAVHAVTEAPVARGVEPWVLEGFADYVALRDVDLPIATTAGQVIDQVRSDGVPEALPTRVDFDTRGAHLGAAYESAWLVCVTLAEHGGEEALVGFYDAVLGGADLEEQLRGRFGWTIADLTVAWQDRLRSIAGTGG
jgi:hypothetical protein